MKNIQLIDSANNCTYSVYSVSDEWFAIAFPDDQDIEFIEDLEKQIGEDSLKKFNADLEKNPIDKRRVNGIHGTIFYGFSDAKKRLYPNKKFRDDVYGFSPTQRRILGIEETTKSHI